jgi:hypothetical protein
MTSSDGDRESAGLSMTSSFTGAEGAQTYLYSETDRAGAVQVRGHRFDDGEHATVVLSADVRGGEVQLSLEPDAARKLAMNIKQAAAFAEGDQ